MEPNIKNIRLLKTSLSYLDSKGIIIYKEDKTTKDCFVATWSMKLKKQYSTELEILKHCRRLTHQENKSDKYVIYLLKT